MARSAGQNSAGVILYSAVLDFGPPAVAGDLASWTQWPELLSANGLPNQVSETQLTHLASPGKAKEFIGGFFDLGDLNAKFNATAAVLNNCLVYSQGTGSGRTNSNLQWFLYLPSPASLGFYFEGFLKSRPIDIPEDDRITADLTIRGSGVLTEVVF